MLPFSLIYMTVQSIRRRRYAKSGVPFKSRCKIISVGNIVSGGSGKTPVTIFLAKYLRKLGYEVAVSHRGYKGKYEGSSKLISNREDLFECASNAGDETYLLAQRLKGIPVVAGKNRIQSVKILEQTFPKLQIIILDDSFQHLKVKHDIDIVVFSSHGLIGNGFVLPAGILRESLSVTTKSDYVIFNGKGIISMSLIKYKKPILQGFYKVAEFYDIDRQKMGIDQLKDKKIALLSGIGYPQSFENTIKECGLNFVEHFIFPDHYHYEEEKLNKFFDKKGADLDFIITTEKDFAKIEKFHLSIPVIITAIDFYLPEVERMFPG